MNSKLSISSTNLANLLIEWKISQKEEYTAAGKIGQEKKLQREKCSKCLWTHINSFRSAVCFDVDSTIMQDETIDEFARFLGKDIQQITKKTMDGYLSFRDSFEKRLAAINPTKAEYEQFVKSFDPKFTPKAIELIGQLRWCGVPSYLVTGGFREIIYEKIAPKLLIPRERIFANVLHFDADGNYAGFDCSQLTSQSGPSPLGKAGVCALLKKRFGYNFLVMIGDGNTDMEARPPADLFIGFGGNQIREKVRIGSDLFVLNFDVLLQMLTKGYAQNCPNFNRTYKSQRTLKRSLSF